MSEFFFLLKNRTGQNRYLNLINNSFSQLTYYMNNGQKIQNGYKYRPALRMQFSPFLFDTTDRMENHYFYPSKIKIMKYIDYKCDLASSEIKIKYQKLIKDTQTQQQYYQTVNPQNFNGFQISSEETKGIFLDCTTPRYSKDSRDLLEQNKLKREQHGIVFNQVVAYQMLNFIFTFSIDTSNNLIQTITAYSDDPTSELYEGSHIVLQNIDENVNDDLLYNTTCSLYYKYCQTSGVDYRTNDIFATVYRPISVYRDYINQYNSLQSGEYISKKSKLTVYFPNFNSVSQTLNDDQLNSSSSNSDSSIQQEYISHNIYTNINAIEYNYYIDTKEGYRSLIDEDCDLNFYSTGTTFQEGNWSYNNLTDDMSYFTRSQIDNRGVYADQTDVSGINKSSQAITALQYNDKNISNFIINRPTSRDTCRKFVLYWDYTKKSSDGTYSLNGIQEYLNTPILITFQFKTWYTTSNNQPQHDISTHYQYGFQYIDDLQQKSKRKIYLLDNNYDATDPNKYDANDPERYNYRQFLLNNTKNQTVTTSTTQLNGAGFSQYINTPSQLFCNVKQIFQSENAFIGQENKFYKLKKYRYSQRAFAVGDSDIDVKWHEITDFVTDTVDEANIKIKFQNNQQQNQSKQKQIWLQLADNQFNVSKVVTGVMTVYQVQPYSKFIKITGTNKNNNYTGVQIDSVTGQFQINDQVTVQFSAVTQKSQVKLYYKITGDIYDQYIQKDESGNYVTKKWSNYQLFSASDNLKKLHLIPSTKNISNVSDSSKYYSDSFYSIQTNTVNGVVTKTKKTISQGCLSTDAQKSITITFRDSAGNVSSITGNIYMNTMLFKTQHKNLRQPSSSYDLQLYKNQSNSYTLISRTDSSTASSSRKWNDIFYPSTHSYPTLADGTIDQNLAKGITNSNANYDPVVTNNGSIVYDSNGRVTTIWNNSKKYPTMVSSYDDLNNTGTGFTYWIIDNKSYGDITLQFEYFYLDNVPYGPPYNQMLGKNTPDILAVYDASQEGCVRQIVNSLGQTQYLLEDTTKLKRLQRYTGYADKAMSYDTGTVNATAQGSFVTQPFGTQRLCLIFYSDCQNSNNTSTSPIGSGFKIKAAKPIIQYWQNFDIDTTNGLVWVHMSSNVQGIETAGQSINVLNMTYDYYNTSITIDYQQGSVIFDQKPQNDVFATYTYYDYNKDDTPPTRDFMADGDDMVDYADLNVYFVNKGVSPTKAKNVTPLYPTLQPGQQQPTYPDGKLVNYFATDKDRGIIQFNNGTSIGNQFSYVPRGRLFGDYRYHTYQRLANDGYSDFEFNDSILVADRTTKYPDFTWGDIKIVNQGDASLQAGQIKFLARGVVTDNVVTQVLDINRPWDVQSGTAQQTYAKTGCQISKNYKWDSYSCTRDQAKAILSKSTVNQFNVSQFESKGILYGRIVLCLGGTNDSYPTTTAGKKVFSSQIAGKFYQQE